MQDEGFSDNFKQGWTELADQSSNENIRVFDEKLRNYRYLTEQMGYLAREMSQKSGEELLQEAFEEYRKKPEIIQDRRDLNKVQELEQNFRKLGRFGEYLKKIHTSTEENIQAQLTTVAMFEGILQIYNENELRSQVERRKVEEKEGQLSGLKREMQEIFEKEEREIIQFDQEHIELQKEKAELEEMLKAKLIRREELRLKKAEAEEALGRMASKVEEGNVKRIELQARINEKDRALNGLKESKTSYEELQSKLTKEERELNQKIQNIKGNVRVCIRQRPSTQSKGELPVIQIEGKHTIKLLPPSSSLKSQNQISEIRYDFQRIFGPTASQSEVYDELSDIIGDMFDGFNISIFSYGNTGSGKTFTIFGDDDKQSQGLIPRTLSYLQSHIEANPKVEYVVSYSFTELYNDKLYSLLDNSRRELLGITSEPLKSTANLKSILMSKLLQAKKRRMTSGNDINDRSSRSHVFFTFQVRSKEVRQDDVLEKFGTVTFVDLAGSEKLTESTMSDKMRLAENKFINKSLTCLRDVLTALAKDEVHIPYRNSKLTTILQDYLGHDAKTVVIVNIFDNQKYYFQTKNSLDFANQIPKIINAHGIRRQVACTPKQEFSRMEQSISRSATRRIFQGTLPPPIPTLLSKNQFDFRPLRRPESMQPGNRDNL